MYFCQDTSVCWLSKNLNIKVSRNIILRAVFYVFETWSLTLRKQCRLRVFENGVLRGIFGPKRDEGTGNGEKHVMRSLMICTPHPIFFG
jgi:hypothetical protein